MIKLFNTKKHAQNETKYMKGWLIKIIKINEKFAIQCNGLKYLKQDGFVN